MVDFGSSEVGNQEHRKSYLKNRWEEDAELMDQETIEMLLGDQAFIDLTTTAIKNTVDSTDDYASKPATEYGFIGAKDYVYPNNKRIYLSPLVKGQEEQISFKLRELIDPIDTELDQNGGIAVLAFKLHTHPFASAGFSRLYHAIFGKTLLSSGRNSEGELFSIQDLNIYKNGVLDKYDNVHALEMIGIQTPDPNKGKLLIVKFRDLDSAWNFKTDEVTRNAGTQISDFFQTGTKPEIHMYSAYKDAGLNVATLDLDLTGQTRWSQDAIRQAATNLLQQKAS